MRHNPFTMAAKKTYLRTDPRDVKAAQTAFARAQKARREVDRELIRRMKSGDTIALEDLDWDSIGQSVMETNAGKAGAR